MERVIVIAHRGASGERPEHTLESYRLAIEQGSLEMAETHLEQAKKIDPTNPEADYLTGVVLQRWQQPQQAYEAYDAAVKKNPDELSYLMAKYAKSVTALHELGQATLGIDDGLGGHFDGRSVVGPEHQ